MKKGKLISWIFLCLMVAVVPFGSWYYLKSGLDFRIDARKSLFPKDSLDLSLDSLGIFKQKTTIVAMQTDETQELNVKLKSQFEKMGDFQLLSLKSLPSNQYNSFFEKYKSEDYLLIDNKGKLRNSYRSDKESIVKLIQHTAITMPKPKDLDIKMQNNGN
jgi:hypothetical protein